MTARETASAAEGPGVVNGPEDGTLDWHAVDWGAAERTVRRLRQPIFTASHAGDLKRVRNLQKLMLRSRANTLLSVRRVTERNAGRKTAGVDGEVVLRPEDKAELVAWVQRLAEPWTARPVKRVYIPKKGTAGKRARSASRWSLTGCSKHGSSMPWSPSGRHGSSRGPTVFGPAVAAMTRSRPSSGSPGCQPQAPVGARRRLGGGVRPDRPFPPPRPARHVPRQGTHRRVAEGGRDRGRLVHPDRGGNSPGRGGEPVAAQRGPARDGAGRRGPLPANGHGRPGRGGGLPGAHQVRRRPRRPVPLQGRGGAGQGAPCRLAGAQGPCLQRGQDGNRHPRRGLRLPGVHRPPTGRQAPDQTEQGGP